MDLHDFMSSVQYPFFLLQLLFLFDAPQTAGLGVVMTVVGAKVVAEHDSKGNSTLLNITDVMAGASSFSDHL